MSRYVLTIHPDDAATWLAMTGRDEVTCPPVQSDAGLEYLLESAQRNEVRITDHQKLEN